MLAFRQLPIELRAPVRRLRRVIERTKIVDMMERGERQLREHGQQVGRPPVQGGRSVEVYITPLGAYIRRTGIMSTGVLTSVKRDFMRRRCYVWDSDMLRQMSSPVLAS